MTTQGYRFVVELTMILGCFFLAIISLYLQDIRDELKKRK